MIDIQLNEKITAHNIGYKILVVRGLVRFVALARFVTAEQEIAPKIHQHFIPGLVKAQAGDNKKKIKKKEKTETPAPNMRYILWLSRINSTG